MAPATSLYTPAAQTPGAAARGALTSLKLTGCSPRRVRRTGGQLHADVSVESHFEMNDDLNDAINSARHMVSAPATVRPLAASG